MYDAHRHHLYAKSPGTRADRQRHSYRLVVCDVNAGSKAVRRAQPASFGVSDCFFGLLLVQDAIHACDALPITSQKPYHHHSEPTEKPSLNKTFLLVHPPLLGREQASMTLWLVWLRRLPTVTRNSKLPLQNGVPAIPKRPSASQRPKPLQLPLGNEAFRSIARMLCLPIEKRLKSLTTVPSLAREP